MANKRISMRKVRELLRLHFEQQFSARKAAKIIGIGKTAASEYLSDFRASGLTYPVVGNLSDSELLNAINSQKQTENPRYQTLSKLFPDIEKELTRPMLARICNPCPNCT